MTRLKKAGRLQTASMGVFLAAGVVGGFAVINGSYYLALINGVLMAINFVIYQTNSRIIVEELRKGANL